MSSAPFRAHLSRFGSVTDFCSVVCGLRLRYPGTKGSAGGTRIINNYIGTNATGTAAKPNLAHGIFVQAANNTIETTTA